MAGLTAADPGSYNVRPLGLLRRTVHTVALRRRPSHRLGMQAHFCCLALACTPLMAHLTMLQRRLAAVAALCCTAALLLAACSLLPGPARQLPHHSRALSSTGAAGGLGGSLVPARRQAPAASRRRLLQAETARERCLDGPEPEAAKAECTAWCGGEACVKQRQPASQDKLRSKPLPPRLPACHPPTAHAATKHLEPRQPAAACGWTGSRSPTSEAPASPPQRSRLLLRWRA